MSRYFVMVLFLCIHNLIFGIKLINLESIDFYRSLEKQDLLFIIHLLEREKYLNQKDELFTYIDLANQALIEKGTQVLGGNDKLDDMQLINSLQRDNLDNYNSSKFVLQASKALNIFVFFDDIDGFLKTLDGRRVSFSDGNFVILDQVSFKGYNNVASEHSTIEIYEKSILNPDFNKLILDKLGFFVYIGELNKKIYFNDIVKLSKGELLFLFYELFPISRLKGIKDWYDFGFTSIIREIKKVYNTRINSRKLK
ncbi:hypothetical protein ACE4V3_01625 [Borrelia recurrentis]|uniref:Uncharacterized conserved protein n=1 Tax=Borrelia recurrentis (strain A1) TaxID=412418 RepID=B5RPN3_BORRA|nr:hypothetical protein [Borrelia recurrentis]ACH94767.1 uncharacterized conserved protein [Borrelia recurrentis A1]